MTPSIRPMLPAVRAIVCLMLFAAAMNLAAAQETPVPGAATDEARARAAILDSPQWRRSMLEVAEWFHTQQLYTPAQAEQIRLDFQQRIAESTAAELKQILTDLQVKLEILDSPQAREARAWMAEYVAVMSDRKREQVVSELPNLATLTSRQLHDELIRIQRKRDQIDQRQAAFGLRQAGKVDLKSQRLAASQTTAANRARPAASHSPYRPASRSTDRLNAPPANNRPSFFINQLGGVGRNLPGAW